MRFNANNEGTIRPSLTIMTPCCGTFPFIIQSNHRTSVHRCSKIPNHLSTQAPSDLPPNAQHTLPYHGIALFRCLLLSARVLPYSHLVAPCHNPASANMPSHCAHILIIKSHILIFYCHALFCVLPAKLPLPFAPVTCPPKKGVGGTRAVALIFFLHTHVDTE